MTPIRTDDQYYEDMNKYAKYNVDKDGNNTMFLASENLILVYYLMNKRNCMMMV